MGVGEAVARFLGARVAELRPVVDSTGRAGVSVGLSLQGAGNVELTEALEVLAGLEHPRLASVSWWGFRLGEPRVVLWALREDGEVEA